MEIVVFIGNPFCIKIGVDIGFGIDGIGIMAMDLIDKIDRVDTAMIILASPAGYGR
jgi:hypothetical protein